MSYDLNWFYCGFFFKNQVGLVWSQTSKKLQVMRFSYTIWNILFEQNANFLMLGWLVGPVSYVPPPPPPPIIWGQGANL